MPNTVDPNSIDSSEVPNVSRRSFLKAAGATAGLAVLSALPKTDGGILFPTVAYADEGVLLADDFVVAALSPSKVGVLVTDVSNIDKPMAVPGAVVKITSVFNEKKIEVTTGKDGRVYVDIKDLAETTDHRIEHNIFGFWAHIQVTFPSDDSYRSFETGMLRVRGGDGFAVPTQKRNGKPYPSRLGIDGMDAAYEEAKFVLSSKNDLVHELKLVMRDMPAGENANIELWTEGDSAPRFTASGAGRENGTCEISIKGKFFLKGDKECLPQDKKNTLKIACGDTKYQIETRFSSVNAPYDEAGNQEDIFQSALLPIDFAGMDLSNFASVKLPFFDASLSVGLPTIPIHFNYNPAGYGVIALCPTDCTLIDQDGKASAQKWKDSTLLNCKEHFTESLSKLKNTLNGTPEGWKHPKGDNSWFGRSGLTKDFSLKLGLQLVLGFYSSNYVGSVYAQQLSDDLSALAPPANGGGAHFGYCDLALNFGVEGSLTEQFMLGPIPTFLSGTLGLDLSVGYRYAVTLLKVFPEVPFDDKNVSWGGTNALRFTVKLALRVTVGVGVKGLLAASLSGGGSLSFYVGKSWTESPGRPDPHLVFGAGASLEFLIQLLFIKISGTIVSGSWPYIFSNWDEEKKRVLVEESPQGTKRFLLRSNDGSNALAYSVTDDSVSLQNGLGFGTPDAFDLWKAAARIVTGVDMRESVEITAQETSAANDPVKAFDYTRTATEPPVFPEGGIKGVSADGVVMPESDTVAWTPIFSDGRQKIVTVGNTVYLFRIVVTAYHLREDVDPQKFHYRPRLDFAAIKDDGSSVDVFTFTDIKVDDYATLEFSRFDMFDYDFDVAATGPDTVAVLLTGGLRPDEDDTTLEQALTASVFSLANLKIYRDAKMSEVLWSKTFSADRVFVENEAPNDAGVILENRTTRDGRAHMITNPRVVSSKVWADGASADGVAFSFIRRNAVDATKLLTDQAETTVEYGFCVPDASAGDVKIYRGTSRAIDAATYDLQMMAAGDYETNLLAFYSDEAALDEESVTKGCVDAYTIASIGGQGAGITTSWARNIRGAKLSETPKPWHGHGGFLAARDKKLYHCTVDATATDAADFALRQIDFDGFEADLFAVNDAGNRLFYINSFDADMGKDYDNPDSPAEVKQQYQISCARLLKDAEAGDSFCSPFAYAQLDHPIDQLLAFADGEKSAFMLAENITDASLSVADLHFVKVPHVALLKAIDFKSKNPFVRAGAGVVDGIPKEPFYVTVQNMGNLIITGFTVVMYDSDTGGEVNRAVVKSIDPAKISYTMDDFADSADPAAQGEDAMSLSASKLDGCIMPGATLAYEADLNIPADWTGNKNVRIETIDYVVPAQDESLLVSCDNGVTEVQPLTNDDTPAHRFTDPVANAVSQNTLDAEAIHTLRFDYEELFEQAVSLQESTFGIDKLSTLDVESSTDGDAPKPDEVAPSDNGSSKAAEVAGAKKTPLSRTADDAVLPSLGTLAVGAAAAGLLAYSRRRTPPKDE